MREPIDWRDIVLKVLAMLVVMTLMLSENFYATLALASAAMFFLFYKIEGRHSKGRVFLCVPDDTGDIAEMIAHILMDKEQLDVVHVLRLDIELLEQALQEDLANQDADD